MLVFVGRPMTANSSGLRQRKGKKGKGRSRFQSALHARPDTARGDRDPHHLEQYGVAEDGFRASWGKSRTKADIPDDLTFHDVRGSAVTRLAEAGCEVPEIATITGHSLKG